VGDGGSSAPPCPARSGTEHFTAISGAGYHVCALATTGALDLNDALGAPRTGRGISAIVAFDGERRCIGETNIARLGHRRDLDRRPRSGTQSRRSFRLSRSLTILPVGNAATGAERHNRSNPNRDNLWSFFYRQLSYAHTL
jgi:hypothetical protein